MSKQRCPGDTDDENMWNDYGCVVCGSRYHCSNCGQGSSMLGHWRNNEKRFTCVKVDGPSRRSRLLTQIIEGEPEQ